MSRSVEWIRNFFRAVVACTRYGASYRQKVGILLGTLSWAREHAAIASTARQPSWETLRASLDAEVALSNLEIAKDFLVLWQTETCPALQKDFAQQYRRMVGVDLSHHDEFKQCLERIRDDGNMVVADLIAVFNHRDQLKGSSPCTADAIAGA